MNRLAFHLFAVCALSVAPFGVARAEAPVVEIKKLILGKPSPEKASPAEAEPLLNNSFRPEGEAVESAEPTKLVPIDRTLKAVLNYPRFALLAQLTPAYVGLKTSNSTAQFNLSSNSFAAATVGGEVNLSSRLSLTLSESAVQVSTAQQTQGAFNVQSSNVQVFSTEALGKYCFYVGAQGQSLCSGLVSGLYGLPVLLYVDNVNLKFSSLNDMTVGTFLNYERPLSTRVVGWSQIRYDRGLIVGQSGTDKLTSDNNFGLAFGAVLSLDGRFDLTGTLSAASRNLQYTTSRDSFSSSITTFGLALGVRYKF